MNSALDGVIEAKCGAQQGQRIADELLALVKAARLSSRLLRELARADAATTQRLALVRALFKGDIRAETVEILERVFSEPARSESALFSRIAHAASLVVFCVAAQDAALSTLEDELQLVRRAVMEHADLAIFLREPTIDDAKKLQLVRDIFGNKLSQHAYALFDLLLTLDHGRDVVDGLELLQEQAAQRNGKVVADITTAIALDEERKQRLINAVQHATGKEIKARFAIDPMVVGSVLVRVGNAQWDGTVRTRLQQAREEMQKVS